MHPTPTGSTPLPYPDSCRDSEEGGNDTSLPLCFGRWSLGEVPVSPRKANLVRRYWNLGSALLLPPVSGAHTLADSNGRSRHTLRGSRYHDPGEQLFHVRLAHHADALGQDAGRAAGHTQA